MKPDGVMGLMGGAMFSHLTMLGIDYTGAGGALFFTAIVLLFSAFVVGLFAFQRGGLFGQAGYR